MNDAQGEAHVFHLTWGDNTLCGAEYAIQGGPGYCCEQCLEVWNAIDQARIAVGEH